jgi:Ferritin-like
MNANGKPTTRRDLLYLLAQASELEHSLVCQYLFTAFSLKERNNEGITPVQQRMIAG